MKEVVMNNEMKTENKKETLSPEALRASADKAKKSFEKKSKEINGKQYLVNGGQKTIKAFMDFMENDAPWTAQEALGVVTVMDRLEKAKDMKEPMLDSDAVEALGYYVGKVTGVGLKSAKKFKEGGVFEPITKMLTRVMQDKKELEMLSEQWREIGSRLGEIEKDDDSATIEDLSKDK